MVLHIQNTNISICSNENDYTLITKATETDILAIKFDYMNVEESTTCVYDSITIYDGRAAFRNILIFNKDLHLNLCK